MSRKQSLLNAYVKMQLTAEQSKEFQGLIVNLKDTSDLKVLLTTIENKQRCATKTCRCSPTSEKNTSKGNDAGKTITESSELERLEIENYLLMEIDTNLDMLRKKQDLSYENEYTSNELSVQHLLGIVQNLETENEQLKMELAKFKK